MKIHYTLTRLLATVIGLTILLPIANASIEIQMSDPSWHFLLNNEPLKQTQAQLQPNERRFAQSIEPMLSSNDYRAALNAFAARDINNDSAALRQLRGQIALKLNDLPQAEKALQAALQIMPDLALAHRSLSMVYMLQKQYDAARAHLQRSIELGVADAQLYGQLAFVNLQTKHPASAVAGYQQALFLEPDNAQWQQGLLYALLNSHALGQAQALVEEMLAIDHASTELWLLRSQIAMQRENPKAALSSLEIALHLGEKTPANLATAAQLHLQHGSTPRAVDLLTSTIKRAAKRDHAAMYATTDKVIAWLIYQRQWKSAGSLLNAVDGKNRTTPANYKARFGVYHAQIELHKGNIKRAQKHLIGALQADPTHGEALLSLADLYRQQSRHDQALMYYARAQALPAYKERALLNRAQLEINRQTYPEALRLLRLVVKGNPNRSDVLANIQSLENLVRNQG